MAKNPISANVARESLKNLVVIHSDESDGGSEKENDEIV